MTSSHEDVNYSMALTVFRLCLNQRTGRPVHRRKAGVAIRGALLAELALAGRIEGFRAPVANGPSDTGAGLADFLHRTISTRSRPVAWRRWFSHVHADVDAATKVLVEAGVWLPSPARRGRFVDAYPDEVATFTRRAFEATSLDKGSDCRELIIGLLAVGAGLQGARPKPRAMRLKAERRLRATLPPDMERNVATHAAVSAALRRMKGW